MHPFDELAASQYALVCRAMLSTPPKSDHRLQPSRTALQATTLQLGTTPLCGAGRDELLVGLARISLARPKLTDYLLDRLPAPGNPSQKRGVSTPQIAAQCSEVAHNPGTQGIQVDVPHQLQAVGVLLNQNGFVAVLKEMAMPPVPSIEIAGIPSQKPSHDCRERNRASAKEKVSVIWKKRPGKNPNTGVRNENGQSVDPLLPVLVISEYGTPLNSPHHNMVQCSRSVKPRTTRHAGTIGGGEAHVKI